MIKFFNTIIYFLESFLRELVVIFKLRELDIIFKQVPVNKDPLGWVTHPVLRKLHWDLFLRHRLPLAIEYEMNSACNRTCSYCPVSIKARPKGFFDKDSYKKLIDELAEHNYRGEITPNFYGEPLLDKRIYDFVHYSRQKLPFCQIVINTNADALNVEKLERLIESGVSIVVISQHDPVPSKAIKTIQDHLEANPERRSQVQIYNWTLPGRILSNRGGLVEDTRVQYMSDSGCFRSRRATLTHDGEMVICCEDYNAEYVYGNVTEKGFMDVWKASQQHRRSIYIGDYQEPICKVCVGQESTEKLPSNTIRTAL